MYLAGRAPDKALEKAELVLKAEPENVKAAILKASVLLREKKEAEARQILNGLLDKGGDRTRCLLAAGAGCRPEERCRRRREHSG